MAVYYPKNKVKTNLKTNGGEFMTSEGKLYVGDYYELPTGDVRAGKFPVSASDPQLFPASSISKTFKNVTSKEVDYIVNTGRETSMRNVNNGLTPPSYFPDPKEADYRKGVIIRYFCRQLNKSNSQIIEISKDTFDDLVNKKGTYNYTLYKPLKLFWKISGPLYDDNTLRTVPISGIVSTNKKIVENNDKNFKGIKEYLSDLAQFAQPQKIDILINQYADSGLLKVKSSNEPFTGYYHVMGDGTIMDGSNHQVSKKVVLVAVDEYVRSKILQQVNETISKLSLDPQERSRIFKVNTEIQRSRY